MIDEQPAAEAPGALRLEFDVRDDDRPETAMIAAPGLEDLTAALASLDQRRHTEVTIVDGSGAYLTVGGGGGRYHVSMGAYDHEDRIVLQNDSVRDDAEIDLVIDGSRARHPARDVVDLETASIAAREFLRSGRPHPDLRWRSA